MSSLPFPPGGIPGVVLNNLVPPPVFPFSAAQFPSRALAEEEVRAPDICEPNETLYLNNLNSRIKEVVIKAHLCKIFSKYGKCEVIAMSSLRRRGQAWVIFESIAQSQAAMDDQQSQLLFGKKMRISFSRNMSDIARVRKGLGPRLKELHQQRSSSAKQSNTETSGSTDTFFKTLTTVPKANNPNAYNPPNRTLFVENLSEAATNEDMIQLFSSYPGFVDARVIQGRGVGFIEFEDDHKSQVALSRLQGFELEKDRVLMISNAKK